MKNIKDIYVVSLFIPEENSLTTEFGIIEIKLCKKAEEKYIDLKNGNIYIAHNKIGYTKVVKAIPLSEYYYKCGVIKRNNHVDKESVRKLVREFKHKGMM